MKYYPQSGAPRSTMSMRICDNKEALLDHEGPVDGDSFVHRVLLLQEARRLPNSHKRSSVHFREGSLTTNNALQPAPESSQGVFLLTFQGVIIYASTRFLAPAAGVYLLSCPFFGPYDFAPIYRIVRLTSLLPISDRRTESRTALSLLESPIGRTQRGPDLGPASTWAEVRCGAKLL